MSAFEDSEQHVYTVCTVQLHFKTLFSFQRGKVISEQSLLRKCQMLQQCKNLPQRESKTSILFNVYPC